MSDINRLLQKQNAKTANGPSVSTIVNQAANPAEVRFTITGIATGGNVLTVNVESIDLVYATVGGEAPATAAAAAASLWQLALDGAYSPGEYTVVDDGDDVVITKTNGTELWVEYVFSTDATQDIDETEGLRLNSALLFEVFTAGTGMPVRYESGEEIRKPAIDGDLSTSMVIETELENASGGLAFARWQVWHWYPSLGWVVDPEIGIRTVTQTTGLGLEKDVIALTSIGSERIAIELVDGNGVGGNLPVGATFSAWGVYLKNA